MNPDLIAEIERWNADAVLVYGWNYHSHLKCMRHFHGKIPVLFRGDSTLLNEKPGLKKKLRTLFLKWVYRHVDFALYVGTNNKTYFSRHGLREEELIHAPHAIDNDRFAEPDQKYGEEARRWRASLGIPPDHLTILYAGKLEQVKNPNFILQLADAAKGLPATFILVGNGHLESELKERAAGNPNIVFVNFQNQSIMPVAYRLGDIFILPSASETWGLGANEAMACRLALMLSEKVGAAIDLVEEGKNGIIFREGDLDKCLGLIRVLVNNGQEVKRMQHNAWQRVQAFSFPAIIRGIETALK
jgi:glycosyltransferase involved in cell wall biosynthesis